LVREQQALAGARRGQRRIQARRTHDGGDHDVARVLCGPLAQALTAPCAPGATASDESRPADPTMAAITMSLEFCVAASRKPSRPLATRVVSPAAAILSRNAGSSALSAMTARSGAKRWHRATSASTLLLAVSALVR